jgi:hypothetical protein
VKNLDDCTVYLFVRGDLKEEDQMIQANHAMYKMATLFNAEYGTVRIVALDGGSSVKAFKKTMAKLFDAKIPHSEYVDPDKPDWGITAIATVPLTKEESLPLSNYRLRRYSPGVPLTTETLASVPAGEPRPS